MTKRTVIILCVVIAILAGIVAIGVCSLYSGVRPSAPAVPVQEEEASEAPAVGDVAGIAAVEVKADDVPEGPFKVKNSGTGKVNTLIQNKDNSIELKDENGKALWTKALGSKLCGMVGEVDFFNNGKIQFLIVEGRNVHLLDRLGKEVSGFPRVLPSKGILGPAKISVKGTNYWKVVTEDGTVYLNLKKNLTLNELPE